METKGMISSVEERTVRRYGLELLFNAAANTAGILLQGVLLGHPLHIIIFYCTYLFFKKDIGGYHAGSHLACILQFNLACFLYKSKARIKAVITVMLLPAVEQMVNVGVSMIDYLYLGLLLIEITVLMGAAQNLYEKIRGNRHV